DATFSWHEDLREIHRAADRSANLTRQLLAFARRQTVLPQRVDLSLKIPDSLSILRRLIGENIELSWHPGIDIWTVRIDPGQVDQILTNLCVNARDAITGNGRICIALHNAFLPGNPQSLAKEEQAGDFVVLSVTDNGCGMNEHVLANLFEPFFTTKAVGKGTGLGLATVYGIAMQNEGFVRVKSAPGQGSTFSVYLPRCISPAKNPVENPPTVSRTVKDNQTVLLVEDEPAILALTTTMLLRLGYTVLAASTPSQAVHLAAEHQRPIDILLTDIIMPEMNGLQLAEKIRELHPTIERLFMSGYTDDVIADHGVHGETLNFIQKPFTKKELANKFAEIFLPV
ncbi:MAG: response regulator, partial [Proteobacteria bacterium]|nr:response regulator [Pseudomonadota bacterium]